MKPQLSPIGIQTRHHCLSRGAITSLLGLAMVFASAKIQAGTFVEWALPVGSPGPTANNAYLATSSEPLHIIPGFDCNGNIFFTQRNLGYLGRLNPENGSITEWSLGNSSFPHDIDVVGGTLVITEEGTGMIGQFEPGKGSIKEWLVPTSGSVPWHQARFQQYIYFSEEGGSKIGRLNLRTNVFAEWNLPTAGSTPTGLEISLDGRYVWFLEYATKSVAVLDVKKNTITEWPDPTAINLSHIKVSGTVAFFTDAGQNSQMIGEIDPSTNTLSIWNTPTVNSEPGDLAVSQLENGYLVEFTEFEGNNIASLDTSKQAPSSTTTVTPATTSETPVSTTVAPTFRTLTKTVTKVQPTVTQGVNPVVTGGFAEWSIPTTDSGPGGIYDFDGLLLFTERAGNKLGVLDPFK